MFSCGTAGRYIVQAADISLDLYFWRLFYEVCYLIIVFLSKIFFLSCAYKVRCILIEPVGSLWNLSLCEAGQVVVKAVVVS